ncbi:uncharacterized protein TNCV_2317681 [Trichonephila clavipes]|nr:uncharacterized protein TNCV_2317681 [Trichonephila clavipes]
MARKRAENRKGSLEFPGFVKPVFTKDAFRISEISLNSSPLSSNCSKVPDTASWTASNLKYLSFNCTCVATKSSVNLLHHSLAHFLSYLRLRNDRLTNGLDRGGTLIFIKSSIPHFNSPTLHHVEATTVTLTPPNTNHISITSIYVPPRSDNLLFTLDLETINAHASASRPFYHTEQPYVQGELKELIKERNKARKTWQQTRHPQHKTELNRLQNAIKRKIYHYRQQAWEDNLSTLNAEDNSLWGIAKAFRKKPSPICALNGPTGIALSDTNKTEVIAHSLESQFQLNDIHNPRKDEIITSVVDAYMDSNTNNTDIIPPLSHLKLFRLLKSVCGEMGSLTKCLKNYRALLFLRSLILLITC